MQTSQTTTKSTKKKNTKQGSKRAASDDLTDAGRSTKRALIEGSVAENDMSNPNLESPQISENTSEAANSRIVVSLKKSSTKRPEKKLSERDMELLRKQTALFKDMKEKHDALIQSRKQYVNSIWSMRKGFSRQIVAQQEPPRAKSHWDFLLEEMMWMATDFIEERKFKLTQSSRISRAVKLKCDELQLHRQQSQETLVQSHRMICHHISRAVGRFWDTQKHAVDSSKIYNSMVECGMTPSEELCVDEDSLNDEIAQPIEQLLPRQTSLEIEKCDIMKNDRLRKQKQMRLRATSPTPWATTLQCVEYIQNGVKTDQIQSDGNDNADPDYDPESSEYENESTMAEEERLIREGDFDGPSEVVVLHRDAMEDIETQLERYAASGSEEEESENSNDESEASDDAVKDWYDEDFTPDADSAMSRAELANNLQEALTKKLADSSFESWVPPEMLSEEGMKRLLRHEIFAVIFLAIMHANNLGAVLADSMPGLGKEKSIITWLAVAATREKPRTPHLIICDEAKIVSWRIYIMLFVPGFRIAVETIEDTCDICILSYDNALNFVHSLQRVHWGNVVWDIASYLENSNVLTRTATLRCQHRIVSCYDLEVAQTHASSIALLLFHRHFRSTEEVESKIDSGSRRKKNTVFGSLVDSFVLHRSEYDIVTDAKVAATSQSCVASKYQKTLFDKILARNPTKLEEKRVQYLGFELVASHPEFLFPKRTRSSLAMEYCVKELAIWTKLSRTAGVNLPLSMNVSLYAAMPVGDAVDCICSPTWVRDVNIRHTEVEDNISAEREGAVLDLDSIRKYEIDMNTRFLLKSVDIQTSSCIPLSVLSDANDFPKSCQVFITPAVASSSHGSGFFSHRASYPKTIEHESFDERANQSGIIWTLIGEVLPRMRAEGKNKVVILVHDLRILEFAKAALSSGKNQYVLFDANDHLVTSTLNLHRFSESPSIHVALATPSGLSRALSLDVDCVDGLGVADAMIILDKDISADTSDEHGSLEEIGKKLANARAQRSFWYGDNELTDFEIVRMDMKYNNEPSYFSNFEPRDVIVKLFKKDAEDFEVQLRENFATVLGMHPIEASEDDNIELQPLATHSLIQVLNPEQTNYMVGCVANEHVPETDQESADGLVYCWYDASYDGVDDDSSNSSDDEDDDTDTVSVTKRNTDTTSKRKSQDTIVSVSSSSKRQCGVDRTLVARDRVKFYLVDPTPVFGIGTIEQYAKYFIAGANEAQVIVLDNKKLPSWLEYSPLDLLWEPEYYNPVDAKVLETTALNFEREISNDLLYYSNDNDTDSFRRTMSVEESKPQCVGCAFHVYAPLTINCADEEDALTVPPGISNTSLAQHQKIVINMMTPKTIAVPKPSLLHFDPMVQPHSSTDRDSRRVEDRSDDHEPTSQSTKSVDWDAQHSRYRPRLKINSKKERNSEPDWSSWEDTVVLRCVERFGYNFDLVTRLLRDQFGVNRTVTQVAERYAHLRSKCKSSISTPWITENNLEINDIAPWAVPPLHRAELLLELHISPRAHVSKEDMDARRKELLVELNSFEKSRITSLFGVVARSQKNSFTPGAGILPRSMFVEPERRIVEASQVDGTVTVSNNGQPTTYSQIIANIVHNQCLEKANQTSRNGVRSASVSGRPPPTPSAPGTTTPRVPPAQT